MQTFHSSNGQESESSTYWKKFDNIDDSLRDFEVVDSDELENQPDRAYIEDSDSDDYMNDFSDRNISEDVSMERKSH